MSKGFQIKTVRRVIRKKVEQWLASLPEDLREQVKDAVIVTGGAPASLLLGEEVKDYDLYFRTKEATAAVAQYYVRRFLQFHPDCKITPEVRVSETRVRIHIQSSGVAGEGGDKGYQYFETDPSENSAEEFLEAMEKPKTDEKPKDPGAFRPRFLSENAISCSDKLQVVIRFYGQVEDIHKNYDFDHCKCAYDHMTDTLHTPTEALLSLMSRTLRYSGSLYPLCSLFRMRKFIERGWHISAGEILKMGFQVSELDLTNVETLREQLVGVDMAYFFELLRVIEDDKKQREGKPIDSTYLALIIDRVFNT
jgi:hypothetical protein